MLQSHSVWIQLSVFKAFTVAFREWKASWEWLVDSSRCSFLINFSNIPISSNLTECIHISSIHCVSLYETTHSWIQWTNVFLYRNIIIYNAIFSYGVVTQVFKNVLLFSYSCPTLFPTAFPCPAHPSLPQPTPAPLPILESSIPVPMFAPSSSFHCYPLPRSPLVTVDLFLISKSLKDSA